jgi:RpiB/LacA/LacB family sugar-phosphate isomerase
MIYITSDHAGFRLKNALVEYLRGRDVEIIDMGPNRYDESDDYPDYVIPTMKKVQENYNNKAIVICRNGVGVCVAANKFNNIRCGLSWDSGHVKTARADDDINVLALPADYIDEEKAKEIALVWLQTSFSKNERHERRLRKVAELDLG